MKQSINSIELHASERIQSPDMISWQINNDGNYLNENTSVGTPELDPKNG